MTLFLSAMMVVISILIYIGGRETDKEINRLKERIRKLEKE